MAQGHAFGYGAAFASQADLAIAGNRDQIVAAHAFERGSNGGRSYAQFFSQARADGRLAFFEQFPDGFEVVFLGDAGFCAHETRESSDCENGRFGYSLTEKERWRTKVRRYKCQKPHRSEDPPLRIPTKAYSLRAVSRRRAVNNSILVRMSSKILW